MDIQLTPRELEIAKEEKRAGFFSNSVPFATLGGFFSYSLLKRKKIIPPWRIQSIATVGFAALLGHIFGRTITNVRMVQRIIREVPDGTLANLAKKARNEIETSIEDSKNKQSQGTHQQGVDRSGAMSDVVAGGKELDDRFRPTTDNSGLTQGGHKTAPGNVSTENFYQNLQKQRLEGGPGEIKPAPLAGPSSYGSSRPEDSPPPKLRVRRNKYGDEIIED